MYNNDFYKNLNKPLCTPAPIVFKSAWGILYLLMAVSFIIIFFQPASYFKTLSFLFFGLQLVLNLLWAPVFFILENIRLALAVAILLTISVIACVFCFAKISFLAASLMIPYLIWLFFACYLNLCFITLNSDKF